MASVLDSSDRRGYIDIRELDHDVLVPWAATAGEAHHALTDRTDAQRRIDAILERVHNGRRPKMSAFSPSGARLPLGSAVSAECG